MTPRHLQPHRCPGSRLAPAERTALLRREPRRARGHPRQRGATAILFAVLLPLLLAVVALVVDIGHLYQVRSRLQNAADAAALAGVLDLDGSATRFARARVSAHTVGRMHTANGTPVVLAPNDDNAPAGDIVLGIWDFQARTFTPATSATPPYLVNAVRAHARRTGDSGGAVATWFARVFGVPSVGVTAVAIAAGGSPEGVCGFPLVVPDCSIVSPTGDLRCNAALRFGPATTDNTGFTLLQADPPVSTPGIECHIDKALGLACSKPCDCTTPDCNPTAVSGGAIYISNGNNLSEPTIDHINQVVAANPDGVFIAIPVIASGLSPAACTSFQFNRQHLINGYVMLRLVGAAKGPPKEIYTTVDCTHTSPGPPGGPFYGLVSVRPYLVR